MGCTRGQNGGGNKSTRKWEMGKFGEKHGLEYDEVEECPSN